VAARPGGEGLAASARAVERGKKIDPGVAIESLGDR
jgi:hypothetical protein